MSAYVCANETINKIVAGYFWCAESGDSLYPRFRFDVKKYPTLAGLSRKNRAEVQVDEMALGFLLRSMNEKAVLARYGGNIEQLPGPVGEDGELVRYEYERVAQPTPAQLLKSIDCLMYQCDEGDIPDLPEYRAMRDFQNAVAAWVARDGAAYKSAIWG